MKKPKAKARKHSEVWYTVKLPIKPAMFAEAKYEWAGTVGILTARRKNELRGFGSNGQKIVKVRITEL